MSQAMHHHLRCVRLAGCRKTPRCWFQPKMGIQNEGIPPGTVLMSRWLYKSSCLTNFFERGIIFPQVSRGKSKKSLKPPRSDTYMPPCCLMPLWMHLKTTLDMQGFLFENAGHRLQNHQIGPAEDIGDGIWVFFDWLAAPGCPSLNWYTPEN